MTTLPMSAAMAQGLTDAIMHGGKLVRHAGGYWTFPGCPRSHNGIPDWYVSTPTVEALIRRERLTYTEWKQGRNGTFPIAAVVNAEARS